MEDMIEFVGGGKVERIAIEKVLAVAHAVAVHEGFGAGSGDVVDIRAALPPKRWEPSEEMIDADVRRLYGDEAVLSEPSYREDSRQRLRRIHEVGVFAAWDAMKEADRG